MNTLALDLGLTAGFASRLDGLFDSGTVSLEVGRDESKGLRPMRLGNFLARVNALCRGGLDLVVFEQVHHRGGAATAVAERFVGKLLEFCALEGIDHKPVHTATLKKWATGKGNAGKPEMMAEARRRHPEVDLIDDNHADALLLLDYALAELVPAATRSE